jgi:1-deoxy-D-xylulose-5-phosphate reductoisomerase
VDIVRSANAAEPGSFRIAALTAHSNVRALAAQALEFRAQFAAAGDPDRYGELKDLLQGSGIRCGAGPSALVEAAAMPSDVVMASIVGSAGLPPALAAARRGAVIGLANKECLVTAGAYFMRVARDGGARIVPVDSEHSAIYQVLDPAQTRQVERVTLTASGGPFRDWTLARMADATPAQACAHPTWSMGAKISVDSATLMNKGLELIEAKHLFDLRADQLDILVHRQSIVHGLLSYTDGSVLAQLSIPDMRTPISLALAYPNRMTWAARRLNLAEAGPLHFETPDESRFPCLTLARAALDQGGGWATVLNAANEEAVAAFLAGNLPFLAIATVNDRVLTSLHWAVQNEPGSLEAFLALDRDARDLARSMIATRDFR